MSEDSQERSIGRMEGKMDVILSMLERSDASRKALYEKVEQTSRSIAAADAKMDKTDAKIDSINERLKGVEEPVAEFNRWRERGVGALLLISIIAASVGGLVATFGKKLWAAIAGS